MPLPAALQARLKKRGITVKAPIIQEEDEIEKKKKNFKNQALPPGWFKVPDPGSGHEYYWNVHTNQVAWRHPNDPRSEITYPASWQQPKQQQQQQTVPTIETKPKEDDKDTTTTTAATTEENKKEDKLKLKIKTGKHPSLLKAQQQKEKSAPYRKGKGKGGKEALDPMDPASYSDIARGSWSTGLKDDSEVNTGVDTTASGPLFQQRPYPSPGDILRRNNKSKGGGEQPVEDDDE